MSSAQTTSSCESSSTHTKQLIPFSLTVTRIFLAPVIVVLAIMHPTPVGFAVCLIIAFLSDIFDGIIARRLKVATPNLRRLDSFADSIFYLGAAFAAWHLFSLALFKHVMAISALGLLELARYYFDWRKFGREASYHMWSSKLWGVALFMGFYSLLVLGQSGYTVSGAIYIGIVADLEGLLISALLIRWTADVPTAVHAYTLRTNQLKERFQ